MPPIVRSQQAVSVPARERGTTLFSRKVLFILREVLIDNLSVGDLQITEVGEQTVNLWMRELGTSIDKIILTTDANYDPNLVNGGLGATESFRADATRFEAEDALLGTGVVVSSDRGGFSGSGFANYPRTARTDAFVEWTVDVATAGSYYLDFAYANGSNIDRAMELSVNNAVVQPTLSFGSTSAWNKQQHSEFSSWN